MAALGKGYRRAVEWRKASTGWNFVHYDPRTGGHGLPHDPFNALVVPRPIGWIATVGRNGVVNLAPYSYFNAVASKPPYVMFSSINRKDSQRNAEETGEFTASLATWDLRAEVNETSAPLPPGESEPLRAGLEMAPSVSVKPPRVARSPAALECTYVKTVDLPPVDGKPNPAGIVIGAVVRIHIDDAFIRDGRFDLLRARPIARLGYMDYAPVDMIFAMDRPK